MNGAEHVSYQELLPDASCPNCGSGYGSYRRVIGWYYYFCGACDLYYLYPRPSEALLTKYYSIMHDNYGEQGRSYSDWAGRLHSDFAAKRRVMDKYLDHHGGPARILDFGCAYGFFLESLPGDRFERFGCDLSARALREARSRLSEDVTLVESADALSRQEGTFDCVTLWATIEHMPDPGETFRTISRLLKRNGILVVDTGLTNDWLSHMLRGNVQWFDGPQHLWVFTPPGMAKLLESCGYTIVHFDGAYERSVLRRFAKTVGVASVAALTRAVNRVVSLEDCKIPVGNLGLWVARKIQA